MFRLLSSCILFIIALSSMNCFAVQAGDYTENGVFLGHAYVKYQKVIDQVATVCDKMQNNYQCRYWFVNCGLLDPNGVMKNASVEMAKLKEFLNEVRKYENSNNYQFKIIAWLNSAKEDLDISSATVRSAVVNECVKFVSAGTKDSYVAGSERPFDGVSFDIEPSGQDDIYFGYYKQLMDQVKEAFESQGLTDKSTSVCAHRQGSLNSWFWSPEYYYEMGGRVDFIVAMTYNSQSTSPEQFQGWMKDQTRTILRAVSGSYWNDAAHPEPANGVKVFIGFAAYPASRWHHPQAENCRYAAMGVLDGLNQSETDDMNTGINYLQGAAVYLYTDGTGQDNYSNEDTDWKYFKQDWLNQE